MDIQHVKNGIILPYKAGKQETGCVLTCEGKMVEKSIIRSRRINLGGYYDWDCCDLLQSTEKVIYFGYFLPHWGHFIMDCLGRMWPFVSDEGELKEYKLAFISEEPQFYPNCYEFFHYLGIEKERILYIEKPTQFNEVLVPDLAYTLTNKRNFSPEYVQMFNKVVNEILTQHSIVEITEKYGDISKVYFTRSRFNGAKSREVGLSIIDKVFNNGGFNIIAPECLSLVEQVLVWNNAQHIACINGTIPLNVIFSIGYDCEGVLNRGGVNIFL